MSLRSFNIYDMIQRNAIIGADTVGIVSDDNRRITFSEFFQQTQDLAGGLQRNGITEKDRIAVLALNDYRFFHLFGAAAALGAVVVPINWRLSTEEIAYILKDASPKMLFIDAAHVRKVGELPGDVLPSDGVFMFDTPEAGYRGMAELFNRDESVALASVDAHAPFCIIYTAAMEGKPRGGVLTQSNIIYSNAQTIAKMEITAKDAYLNMLPLFHITGLNLAFSVMHSGGKNVVVQKFDEKEVCTQTEKEQITLLGSFPPILSRLTQEIDAGNYDMSSLRIVLGIDGPDNIRPFEEKTRAKFWILYGQTETSGLVTFSPAMERPGAAGTQGLFTKMKIVDADEREVPCGELGEIVVQGPLVFDGYWNQPELNQKTFRAGWHHTGDLGKMDANGYLWFGGRKPEKDLIKPGGENVYPAEVEDVILQHPSIEAVSVIGVPDPRFGEGVKAVCVTRGGESLTAKDLIEFVGARIARYKKPRYVEFVEQLPTTPDGKIDRIKVKQWYGAQ